MTRLVVTGVTCRHDLRSLGILSLATQSYPLTTSLQPANDPTRMPDRAEATNPLELTSSEVVAVFQSIASSTEAVFFLVQGDKFVWVNSALEATIGYTREELLSMDYWELVHPDDQKIIKDRGRHRQAGATVPNRYEFKLLAKNGEVLWFDLAVGLINLSGKPTVVATALEITALKEVEADLRASEARLRAFANAVADVAFVIGEDGTYLEVLAQPAREQLLYANADNLRGRMLHDVLPKESADLFLTVIRKAIRTQEPQLIEYSLDVQAGVRWFEGRAAPLLIPGEGSMVVWVSHNITERKEIEKAIQTSREDLEAKTERLFERMVDRYRLTFRELTVLNLVAEGKPDREIGVLLGISTRTVNKHVENVLEKMNASSRTEAGVRASREGLLSED